MGIGCLLCQVAFMYYSTFVAIHQVVPPAVLDAFPKPSRFCCGDLGHQDHPCTCLSRPHFQNPQTAAEEARDHQVTSALILLARTRDVEPW